MLVEVYSDVVCPWCYIGRSSLEQALGDGGPEDVEIVWRAFQLNPDLPEGGMARDEYLRRKFGSADAGSLFDRVTEAARQVGLTLHLERIQRAPNTLNAHRLVRYARERGGEEAVVEALFRAYLVDGRDVGDRDVLAAVAAECGLDGEAARSWLNGEDAAQAVRAEDARARELGIQGVPTFVLDQRYMITGAQAPESLRRALLRAAGSEQAPGRP